MNLLELNTLPTHEFKIPSMGVTVEFRPYLVSEEKILLMARESENIKDQLKAIKATVEACIIDKSAIDVSKLTTFDVEYLFVKIRSASVGGVANLILPCTKCKHENTHDIDIDKVKLEVDPKKDNQDIEINSNLTITMGFPLISSVIKRNFKEKDPLDIEVNTIICCMQTIKSKDETELVKDIPEDILQKFVRGLRLEDFAKLAGYCADIPNLNHDTEFYCQGCGELNKLSLEGLSDFF